MPTYNVQGWVWTGTGSPTTLLPVTIEDDDPDLSPYFTNDFNEEITISGTTYTNPNAGTYELTFEDSGGTTHTEDLLLFYTGSNFIFVPLPGSNFDAGSIVTSLGGWQDFTSGFAWVDVTCFTLGTLIGTSFGELQVELLSVGDLVETSEGYSSVAWIGRRIVQHDELKENPKLRPIRIVAGALGNGLPKRDLLVSRQHRMVIQSKITERMFDATEVLVPAIKLTGLPGIYVDEDVETVEYFHLLFDQHEIIFAEGAPTESLFTGPEALKSISEDAREELVSLFPELADKAYAPEPARFIPSSKHQKRLIERHVKNNRPLIS